MFRTYQSLIKYAMQISDASIVLISFLAAWYTKFVSGWLAYEHHLSFTTSLTAVSIALPVLVAVNAFNGLYKPMRIKSLSLELITLFRSCAISVLLLMSGLYFLKVGEFSRGLLLIFVILYLLLMICERVVMRLLLRTMRAHGFNQKFILVVGWNSAIQRFLNGLEQHPWFGYRIVGYLADPREGTALSAEQIWLGKLDELPSVLRKQVIDHVIIALPRSEHTSMTEVINHCEQAGIQSLIVPDYFDLLPARPRFETFGDMPLIDTRYVPLDDAVNAVLKRSFDVIFSILVLVLLSPLFILIAVGVKLTSPGPAFYTQVRVGKSRREFKMFKYRTMYFTPCSENDSFGWTLEDDPRRTPIGAFLRKTSLDELPQFLNVLIGNMSVIGPRPERPYYVDQFRAEVPRYMIKHRVRPGITGWAQVNGWRGDTSISERIKYDLDYIENWSFTLDLKIIIRTFRRGMIHPNAY